MAHAERVEDEIVVATEFIDREMISQVPGFTWDPRRKMWHGPLSWGSCISLRGVFQQRLTVGPALAEWATIERVNRVDPCNAIRGAVEPLWPDCDVQSAIARWEARLHTS